MARHPKRYLGNTNKMEVHDTQNEKPGCQLDEIKPEHRIYFDTLEEAHRAGFDNCAHCIGKSKR